MFFGKCCCSDAAGGETQISHSAADSHDAVCESVRRMVPVGAVPACGVSISSELHSPFMVPLDKKRRARTPPAVGAASPSCPWCPGTLSSSGKPQSRARDFLQDPGICGKSLQDSEKMRLQKLLGSFMKRAVKGCPCTCVSQTTGARWPALYVVPKSLDIIAVKGAEASKGCDFQVPISNIQDVYCLADDGEHCFSPMVIMNLRPAERELLLMVVLRDGQRFSLIEDNAESRDTLLECLRILVYYAKSMNSSSVI